MYVKENKIINPFCPLENLYLWQKEISEDVILLPQSKLVNISQEKFVWY